MRVVAEELVRLATTTLDASTSVAEDWAGTSAALAPSETAAGDVTLGPSFVAGVHRVAEAADLTIGRIVGACRRTPTTS